MSTAKERYYEFKGIADKCFEGVRDPIHEYVAELEQEKAELIDNIEKIKSLCKSKAVNNHLGQIFIISDIILNKHTEAK